MGAADVGSWDTKDLSAMARARGRDSPHSGNLPNPSPRPRPCTSTHAPVSLRRRAQPAPPAPRRPAPAHNCARGDVSAMGGPGPGPAGPCSTPAGETRAAAPRPAPQGAAPTGVLSSGSQGRAPGFLRGPHAGIPAPLLHPSQLGCPKPSCSFPLSGLIMP